MMEELRKQILLYLEKHSRVDLGELAVLLGTDEVTVANEISAMERAKIICGYHTLIDWDKTGTEYTNNYFLAKQKDMHYAVARINKDFVPTKGGYEVTLSCDVFARGVFLSLQEDIDNFISDNYMDILPGKPVTLKVTTELPSLQFAEKLQVASFSDAVEQ